MTFAYGGYGSAHGFRRKTAYNHIDSKVPPVEAYQEWLDKRPATARCFRRDPSAAQIRRAVIAIRNGRPKMQSLREIGVPESMWYRLPKELK